MVGRGIAVAGIWLGIGMAIGMTGLSSHPSLPGWVYKWIIGGGLIATMPIVLPLLAPQSWDKNG